LLSHLTSDSIISHRLVFSSILEEVPLKIRTNALLSAFLSRTAEAPSLSEALGPCFAALDLGRGSTLTRSLEQLTDSIDAYRVEEGNLAYLSRQIAREKARADNYVAKRKEENATRVQQGLAPLPEEDVGRLFKIAGEPSRLESMLLLGQIDAYGKSLEVSASGGVVKMYVNQG
jgi:translation initiation factor 3 subunit H